MKYMFACYSIGVYIMNLEKWLKLLTNERCLQNRLDAVLLSVCIFCCMCVRCIALSVAKKKSCLNPSKYLLGLSEETRIWNEAH